RPLRVIMIGTDFEVRVWEKLLHIPMGVAATYSGLAQEVGCPNGARAVGLAVGKNPISFVVPCHRVIGKSGDITGYHWGLTRKRAILGWEAGMAGAEQPFRKPRNARLSGIHMHIWISFLESRFAASRRPGMTIKPPNPAST